MQYTRDVAEKIIGDAAKADAEARERLTQSEIEDAAADVGIGRDAVRTVIARETEATERNEQRRRELMSRLRSAFFAVAAGAAFVAFVGVMVSWLAYRDAMLLHSRVEAERHNVVLAFDNRTLVARALDTAINDGERATVLERAERRISVAKRDYNDAVTTYNSVMTGWFARRVVRNGSLPGSEPYADAVWR